MKPWEANRVSPGRKAALIPDPGGRLPPILDRIENDVSANERHGGRKAVPLEKVEDRVDGILEELHGPLRILRGNLVERP